MFFVTHGLLVIFMTIDDLCVAGRFLFRKIMHAGCIMNIFIKKGLR